MARTDHSKENMRLFELFRGSGAEGRADGNQFPDLRMAWYHAP